MRVALLVGSVVALGAMVALVASTNSACCGGGAADCVTAEFAYVALSCANSDLTSVRITGVCASDDANTISASVSDSGFASNSFSFGSLQPGPCHFELTFASGFTYSGDVTFYEQAGMCSCQSYLAPSQAKFVIDNPSSTCLGDGGRD